MNRFFGSILTIFFLLVVTDAQELCVIVNKENAVDRVSLNDLRRIYLSQKLKWNNGEKIITTMHPAGSVERQSFLTLVIGFKTEDFLQYYDNERMKGNIITKPISLNNDQAILRFVQKNPNAIGFVNCSSVDTSVVKILKIDGFSHEDKKYPIRK